MSRRHPRWVSFFETAKHRFIASFLIVQPRWKHHIILDVAYVHIQAQIHGQVYLSFIARLAYSNVYRWCSAGYGTSSYASVAFALSFVVIAIVEEFWHWFVSLHVVIVDNKRKCFWIVPFFFHVIVIDMDWMMYSWVQVYLNQCRLVQCCCLMKGNNIDLFTGKMKNYFLYSFQFSNFLFHSNDESQIAIAQQELHCTFWIYFEFIFELFSLLFLTLNRKKKTKTNKAIIENMLDMKMMCWVLVVMLNLNVVVKVIFNHL